MSTKEIADKWLPGPGAKASVTLVFALPGLLYTNFPSLQAILPPLSALHMEVLRILLSLTVSIVPLVSLLVFVVHGYRDALRQQQLQMDMIDLANRTRHQIQKMELEDLKQH
jgi:hypothetical protein